MLCLRHVETAPHLAMSVVVIETAPVMPPLAKS
jgi:hypothetical protein